MAIDAPEIPGHCRRGRRCTPGNPLTSKASLARLTRTAAVQCRPEGRDHYGRLLARCQAGGLDLACEQVRLGHAVERYGVLTCRR